MLKMTIDNEEVVSDKDITINEEMLSASSTILNNVYPKEWEEDKDYTSRFYYPQDYSKALIQRSYVTQEAEAGTTIQVNGSVTLTDVDTTKNSRVLRLLGQTSQNGTPTPSSPIPVNVVSGDNEIVINGKNILDVSQTIVGKAWNNSSNSARAVCYAPATEGLDYTGSFTGSSVDGVYLFFKANKEDSTIIGGTYQVSGSRTLTAPTGTKYIGVQFAKTSITLTDVENSKIMVARSTNTTYEPYIGNTYNIDLPVENSFDISAIKENTYINTNGATGTSTSTNLSGYTKVVPSATYTLSYTYTTLANPNTRSYCWYDESKVLISGDIYTPANAPITLTVPNNARYIRFGYDKNCTNIKLKQDGTTPIELCKIGNYQDYFYKDSGKWYLHKEIGKVVLNGSEDIAREQIANNHYKFYIQNISNVDYGDVNYIPKILCNKLIAVGRTPMYVNTQGITSGNGSLQIYTDDTKDMTVSEFRTWLGSNNIIAYYGIITSTNTEITYEPLIEQLNALSSQ